MLCKQLKALKDKRNLTNQQLSDLSGIPIGTINRIMAGQTDNHSFQTVCDMVIAMGGSLDELVGIAPPSDGKDEREIQLNVETSLLYKETIKIKDRWIHRLFICCCFFILFIMGILIYDVAHPAVGFFQR